MKNTKLTLLSIAIIVALPFAANATGPAQYSGNSPVMASTTGPYQTATIGEHDDEHIATTAYVKGAYNDTIAAVNKVDSDKQVKIKSVNVWNGSEQDIEPKVMGSGFVGGGTALLQMGTSQERADEYTAMIYDISQQIGGGESVDLNDTLISAGVVIQMMREAGDVINGQTTAMNNKRVRIYTTWGTDTAAATTLVPFETAQQ